MQEKKWAFSDYLKMAIAVDKNFSINEIKEFYEKDYTEQDLKNLSSVFYTDFKEYVPVIKIMKQNKTNPKIEELKNQIAINEATRRTNNYRINGGI